MGTANFSYSPNERLDLTGFLIFNSSLIDSKENSLIRYTNANLQIPDEAIEQTSTERSNQSLIKLSASFKPDFSNQMDYDVLVRTANDRQQQNVFSSVIGNTGQVEEVTPYSINQTFNYYYTLDENNIFAFETQHLIKNEDPFYSAIIDNTVDGEDVFDATAKTLGLNNTLPQYTLAQDRKISSNQLDAKLDYYYIINPKSNLNLTLGTILKQAAI